MIWKGTLSFVQYEKFSNKKKSRIFVLEELRNMNLFSNKNFKRPGRVMSNLKYTYIEYIYKERIQNYEEEKFNSYCKK